MLTSWGIENEAGYGVDNWVQVTITSCYILVLVEYLVGFAMSLRILNQWIVWIVFSVENRQRDVETENPERNSPNRKFVLVFVKLGKAGVCFLNLKCRYELPGIKKHTYVINFKSIIHHCPEEFVSENWTMHLTLTASNQSVVSKLLTGYACPNVDRDQLSSNERNHRSPVPVFHCTVNSAYQRTKRYWKN